MLDKFIHIYNTYIPLTVKLLNLNFNTANTTENPNIANDNEFKITWTGNLDYDNAINSVKSRCLIFINYYFAYTCLHNFEYTT